MDIRLERKLIKQAKKDPEAFGQLFDHYYPLIFKFVYKRIGNREIAQDITSEVFFQAIKNLWHYRITKKPFKAWLYKIAVTQIAMYYRQKGNYCELALDKCPELMAHDTYQADTSTLELQDCDLAQNAFKELHKVLLKLSKVQHTIIILRFFENKKIKEISQILSLKENTVKSHIRRSLKKISTILNNQDHKSFEEYAKQHLSNYRKILNQGSSKG